jgi:hypothetical protein
MIKLSYHPELEISAERTDGLMDTKIGQGVELILNYVVIAKTKSYTMFRITSAYRTTNDRRVY